MNELYCLVCDTRVSVVKEGKSEYCSICNFPLVFDDPQSPLVDMALGQGRLQDLIKLGRSLNK